MNVSVGEQMEGSFVTLFFRQGFGIVFTNDLKLKSLNLISDSTYETCIVYSTSRVKMYVLFESGY